MRHFHDRLRNRVYSIGTSMVLYFVLLISVVILLVSILSYTFSVRDMQELSISYTESLIAEINAGVDSYIDNIKSMSSVICENRDVQALMALYNGAAGETLTGETAARAETLRQNTLRHLQVVAGTRSEITNIAVISLYHDVVFDDAALHANPCANYEQADWYLKPLTSKEKIVVSPSHVQDLVNGEYRWVISISRAVLDPDTGEVTGVMVIDLSFYAIRAICETVQLGQNGYAYLIDDNRNIIYHPQQQLLYAGVKTEPLSRILGAPSNTLAGEGNRIYVKNRSELTGWTTVGVINGGELLRGRAKLINFYFTLSALSLLFASLAALGISSSITRPLKQLEATMHGVEEGDLTLRASTDVNNEIGHLGKVFNTMISRLRALMETTVANEEAKRKSEINALQAQINPHFLYNTLDSIIWMSAAGKNEEVTEMTAALAKLFRTSISMGDNFVPLRNETENIRSYLTIQKMRYGDKLSYVLAVDDGLLDYLVPKLILQPIVENALYHGIKLSPRPGTITIGGYTTDTELILTVQDDGVGMTAEQLAHLFDARENGDRGIGVQNVQNRIRLCYGPAYGLRYTSDPGTGTRVEIHLPLGGAEVRG